MTQPQTVLITGASSGLGRACAQTLHQAGHRVYGTSRRIEGPTPQGGERGWVLLPMDVTDDDSVTRGVAWVLGEAGAIDVLVCNAGAGIAGPVAHTDVGTARELLDVNLFGAARMLRAVLPSMQERRRGRVILMGSVGGRVGLPYQAYYSASKFALEGLAEALRLESRPFGLQVSLVEPGDAATGFTTSRRRVLSADAHPLHRERMERALGVMEADERAGLSPERVSRVVARIVAARRPRLRYVVASPAQALVAHLRAMLPDALVEWALAKYYRLDAD